MMVIVYAFVSRPQDSDAGKAHIFAPATIV
jgi:hypothetical protein